MNFLKSLLFGNTNNTVNNTNINNTSVKDQNYSKILEKYSLSYCPYRYQNSGMINDVTWREDQYRWKVTGIERNETDWSSTFPDFNEKVFDTEHYEQIIGDLERTYTAKAFEKKQNIEITKRIRPVIFNYNEKDYDLSYYDF